MISTVITTKNGSKYIENSINSVLSQTYATNPETADKLEIVVVSDGSTDTTVEIVRGIILKDSRVKLIELNKNIGPGLARDLAIKGGDAEGKTIPSCSGEYIALIDDDDLWINKDKLKNQSEYLDKNTSVVVVGSSDVAFVREHTGNTWWLHNSTDPKHIHSHMLSYNPVITSSVLFRKDTYIKAGGFSNMYLAEDYDLWLRMGQFGDIVNIKNTETQYTIRDSSASKTKKMEMNKVVLGLAKKYKDCYPNYFRAFIKGYARVWLLRIKNLLK